MNVGATTAPRPGEFSEVSKISEFATSESKSGSSFDPRPLLALGTVGGIGGVVFAATRGHGPLSMATRGWATLGIVGGAALGLGISQLKSALFD